MDILLEIGRGVILPNMGSKDLQVQFSQLYEAERFSAYFFSRKVMGNPHSNLRHFKNATIHCLSS